MYRSGLAPPFVRLAWFCQAVSVRCHWLTVFPGLSVLCLLTITSVQNQPVGPAHGAVREKPQDQGCKELRLPRINSLSVFLIYLG